MRPLAVAILVLWLAGCACLPEIEDEGSALTCLGELMK